jgi:hypothetical protein
MRDGEHNDLATHYQFRHEWVATLETCCDDLPVRPINCDAARQ